MEQVVIQKKKQTWFKAAAYIRILQDIIWISHNKNRFESQTSVQSVSVTL